MSLAIGMVDATLLALGSLWGDPLGRLLVAVVILAVVVLIGRLVLRIAWKLLVIAAVIIGAIYLGSLLLDMVGMVAV